MAVDKDLKRIHVFPSESSYNTNKGSVTDEEIALVKTTNLAVPGYVTSNGVKLLPIQFKSLTKLTSKYYGAGNIPLSSPYTNFDGLYIEVTNDGRNNFHSYFISSWELSRRISQSKALGHPTILLFASTFYWSLNASSTTTTNLVESDNNCVIENIYGVKL